MIDSMLLNRVLLMLFVEFGSLSWALLWAVLFDNDCRENFQAGFVESGAVGNASIIELLNLWLDISNHEFNWDAHFDTAQEVALWMNVMFPGAHTWMFKEIILHDVLRTKHLISSS